LRQFFGILPTGEMCFFVYYYNLKCGYFLFGDSLTQSMGNLFAEYEISFPFVKKSTFIVLESEPNVKQKKGQHISKNLTVCELVQLDKNNGWFKTTEDILKKIVVIIREYGKDLHMHGKQEETGRRRLLTDNEFQTLIKSIVACTTDSSKATIQRRYLKLI
jgi:hypothetical protein